MGSMMAMARLGRWLGRQSFRLTLHALFFFSGFCALGYEVLWLRQTGILLGADALAVGIVAAIFMGGMSLGYLAGGRLSDRCRVPLAAFGALEIGIGLLALGLVHEFRVVPALLASLVGEGVPASISTLLNALCAVVLLLPPTLLMGATLPVLALPLSRSLGSLPRGVGLLYGANLLGAAVGALAAGCWLLDELGAVRSIQVLALGNLGIGLAALLVQVPVSLVERACRGRTVPPRADSPALVGEAGAETSLSVRVRPPGPLLLVAALTGAISMIFQIIWIRSITPFIGSTLVAMSCTLAVFLLGLGLGSQGMSGWLGRTRGPDEARRALRVLLLLLGAVLFSVLLVLLLWYRLEPLEALRIDAHAGPERPAVSFPAALRLVLVTVLPPTLIIGAFPPLLTHLGEPLQGEDGRPGRLVGWLYGANSLGAVTGVLFAQFLGLPLLGTRGGLLLLAALCLAAGLAGPIAARVRRPWVRAVAHLGAPALVMAAGLALLPVPMALFMDEQVNARVMVYSEAPEGSMAAVWIDTPEDPTPGAKLALFVNGHLITTALDDGAFSRMTGQCLPEPPRRMAVIGIGSGADCERAVELAQQGAECVEILAPVIEAQPLFRQAARRPEPTRPYRYIQGDGRSFLRYTEQRYDALVVDCTQVEYRGGYELFTHEFYTLTRRVLTRDGVLGIWVPMNLSFQQRRSLKRTLLSVYAWTAEVDSSFFLSGRGDPARLRCRPIELHRRLATGTTLGPGPIYTDDHPALLYEVLRPLTLDALKPVIVPYHGISG